jgi:hypothetical protein
MKGVSFSREVNVSVIKRLAHMYITKSLRPATKLLATMRPGSYI